MKAFFSPSASSTEELTLKSPGSAVIHQQTCVCYKTMHTSFDSTVLPCVLDVKEMSLPENLGNEAPVDYWTHPRSPICSTPLHDLAAITHRAAPPSIKTNNVHIGCMETIDYAVARCGKREAKWSNPQLCGEGGIKTYTSPRKEPPPRLRTPASIRCRNISGNREAAASKLLLRLDFTARRPHTMH